MIILPSRRTRASRALFEFRASDCVDESGLFAHSYGSRVAAVLSRPSRKYLADQNGRLFVSPIGAPSIGRLAGSVFGLEGARTNLCIRSEEFETWTDVSTCNVTANTIAAPDGALTADMLTASGTGSHRQRVVSFTGDGEKCYAVFLRAGSSLLSNIRITDTTASINRHSVNVTWTDGKPTLSSATGTGAVYEVEPLVDGWYRCLISASGIVAGNTNTVRVYPDVLAGTGTVYAWGAQAEDAVVPSSYIKTEGSAVTRSADSCYFPTAITPRSITIYMRSINRGMYVATGVTKYGAHFGAENASSADPRFALFSSGGGSYGTVYDDGSTLASISAGSARPLGDVVEQRGVLLPDWRCYGGRVVNGGNESVTALSSTSGPSAAWNQPRLCFTNVNSGQDSLAYTHVVVAEGDRSMAEMRELAGI